MTTRHLIFTSALALCLSTLGGPARAADQADLTDSVDLAPATPTGGFFAPETLEPTTAAGGMRPFVVINPVSAVVERPTQDPGQGLDRFPYAPSRGYYFYRPAQALPAYGFDLLANRGEGQTVAVVEGYVGPDIQRDLDGFCHVFGLPDTGHFPFRVVRLGSPAPQDGWAVETALDVEWLHAVAPRAAIVVFEAAGQRVDKIMHAVRLASAPGAGVNVVSMSFGSREFAHQLNYDANVFQEGVSRGITYVASSGDRGARVSYPASSPYVVGVGGTKLRYDADFGSRRETGWSGSGGGKSVYALRPTYQDALTTLPTTPNRRTPDVAYNANPYAGFMVLYTNPDGVTRWVSAGGTSAGAPQWAALVAVANSLRARPLSSTQVLAALYRLGKSSSYPGLYDITRGPATSTQGIPGSTEPAVGYDEVTGLGSPNAAVLVEDLVAQP